MSFGSYSPESDPRHLPQLEIQARIDQLDAEASDLLIEINAIDAVLAAFDSEGFAVVMSEIERHADDIDRVLRRTVEPLPWQYLRGQLMMTQWLQGLPEEYRKMRAAAVNKMQANADQVDRAMRGAEG